MVIHKSLRDFRTRLRNNQDRHGRKEHIHRERERETLQVSVLPYRCSICAPLVSVSVVAQSSSEIPEGLMNNPVLYITMMFVGSQYLANTCIYTMWRHRSSISPYFVYLSRKRQDIINKEGNVIRLLSLPDFNQKLNSATQILLHVPYIKISRKSVQWEPRCSMRTDRREAFFFLRESV